MELNPTAVVFGVILRELRNIAGFSQEKLALEAPLDRSYVSELETGQKQPTLETLLKAARVLNVAPETIVARVNELLNPSQVQEAPPQEPRAVMIPLGEETCPRCNAVYSLHACRLASKSKGRFRCANCKELIGTWSGTTALVYSIVRVPGLNMDDGLHRPAAT